MLFIIRTSPSVEDTTLGKEVYLDSSGVISSGVRRFSGQYPHERARNLNPYLDEVRGGVGSFRAADAGRPSPGPVYWVIDSLA